jgi:hypothetical protein
MRPFPHCRRRRSERQTRPTSIIVIFRLLCMQEVLSILTLVYEPKSGGREGVAGSQSMSIQLCTGAQINFGDLYTIYDCMSMFKQR